MSRFLPRTAAGQLIAVAMIALAISQAALIAILIDERQSAIRRWWTEYIIGRIASVVELLDETPEALHQKVLYASDTPLLTLFISDAGPGPEDGVDENSIYIQELRAMIQKEPAKVLVALNDTPTSTEILQHWLAAWRSEPPPESEPWLEAAVQLKNGKWLNLEVARRFRPPSLALVLVPVGTMLLIFGSMLVLSIRRITRPIDRLAAAAEAFGRGEGAPPIPVTGPEEIRRAIEAFNDMRERLSRFVLDRTRMLAAVGHDLRTPITSMRLRAEFIEDEETRARILASLDEIQQMAEAALAFAREEVTSEPMRTVDLSALVQTVCEDQADMNRDVVYEEQARILYKCRPHSLTRAVRNLVENAVIHGKHARVSLNGPPQSIHITIDDDGPGIAASDMSRVFAPFVRLDESRGQETGGIGLGLAIARSIVRGHGGDILLQNRPEGGLSATIQLPLNR